MLWTTSSICLPAVLWYIKVFTNPYVKKSHKYIENSAKADITISKITFWEGVLLFIKISEVKYKIQKNVLGKLSNVQCVGLVFDHGRLLL